MFLLSKIRVLQVYLRRLAMVSSSGILMGQYYKPLSVAATIMMLNEFPIIAEQVVAIFMTSLVTIATVLPVQNTLNFPFKRL